MSGIRFDHFNYERVGHIGTSTGQRSIRRVAISILPVLSALSNRHSPWASAGAVGISGSTMLGIFSDTYIYIYIFGCCVSDASCSRHKLLKVENCWRCIRLGGGKYECVWSQTHDFPFSVVPAFIFYWFLLSLPHTKCSSTTSSTIPFAFASFPIKSIFD